MPGELRRGRKRCTHAKKCYYVAQKKEKGSTEEAASAAWVANAGRGSNDRQRGIVASLAGNVHPKATSLGLVLVLFSSLLLPVVSLRAVMHLNSTRTPGMSRAGSQGCHRETVACDQLCLRNHPLCFICCFTLALLLHLVCTSEGALLVTCKQHQILRFQIVRGICSPQTT